MASFIDSIKNVWNAFRNNDRTPSYRETVFFGQSSTYRPDKAVRTRNSDRSIVTALYTRIAMDVAAIPIKHVRVDENGRYLEEINSNLNERFNLNANIDQTSRAFVQDVVISMFDEGVVAIVPVDTTSNPFKGTFDVYSLRTGKVTDWYPLTVRVKVYNERTGKQEEIILPKNAVPLIENPFYSIMNEPNSILQRLLRKLALLDSVDEQSSAGKLDLIIQLPYSLKTEARIEQAEKRKAAIETQLRDSKYGIAYIDSTEHVTQLNRPLENNLMAQIEYLTSMLYSQLGMSNAILDGSADEKVMNNYQLRIVEPIVSAICDGLKWKFLSKTARTQGQDIMFFTEPLRFIPTSQLGSLADTLSRNAIVTSNEFRQVLGLKPSDNPDADELRNKNLNRSANEIPGYEQEYYEEEDPYAETAEEPVDESEPVSIGDIPVSELEKGS